MAEIFTIEQAHREMQLHRNCQLEHCPRSAVAFGVLVEAGHAMPDSSWQK
ncbi:hypothetical protein [Nocardia sp. MW-W600-9]